MKKFHFLLSLAALVLIALNLRAPITAVGAVSEQLRAEFSLSPQAFGALGAMPLFCFFAFALIAPFFARTKAIAIALAALCAGLLLRPAGGNFALFAGTAAIGAGIAVLNVMMPSFIKQNFSARVPQMMALYSLLLSLSSLVGVFSHYAAGALGARWVLALWAVLGVAAAAAYAPFVRRSRWRRPSSSFSPQAFRAIFRNANAWKITAFMGLQSCVFYTVINWYFSVLKARLDGALAASLTGGAALSGRMANSGVRGGDSGDVGDSAAGAGVVDNVAGAVDSAASAGAISDPAPLGSAADAAAQFAANASTAANILLLFQIFALLTSFFIPLLAARWRQGRPAAAKALVHGVCACNVIAALLLLAPAPSLAALLASALLFSVPVGGIFGIALAAIATKASSAAQTVYLSAMAQSVGYLIAAFGPWIFGFLAHFALPECVVAAAGGGSGEYFYSLLFLLCVSVLLWIFAAICEKISKI